MNFSIQNRLFLLVGIMLLLVQSHWYFTNKVDPNKWKEWGRSKRIQDFLWIFFGILFILSIFLIILSFESIIIGIFVFLFLSMVVLPFFWGLIF